MIPIWKEYYFEYRRGNYQEIVKSLQWVDWHALFSDNNVNEKWAIFKVVLDNAVSKFVPKRKRRSRQKQLWWTRGNEQAGMLKQKMWNIYKDTKDSYIFYNCKMAQNNATKAISSWKRNLDKIACNIKNDTKTFYRYKRKKMKTKDSVGALINENDDVISDGPRVATMQNKYFTSVLPRRRY